jgi:hypothetical protein
MLLPRLYLVFGPPLVLVFGVRIFGLALRRRCGRVNLRLDLSFLPFLLMPGPALLRRRCGHVLSQFLADLCLDLSFLPFLLVPGAALLHRRCGRVDQCLESSMPRVLGLVRVLAVALHPHSDPERTNSLLSALHPALCKK